MISITVAAEPCAAEGADVVISYAASAAKADAVVAERPNSHAARSPSE
ncbi:MAG: hypothetical protein ACRDGM_04000 [bacterium]